MNRVKVNSDIELKDRLVAINRVTKVTKGGRTFTFAAIVVVGDGNGVIGWGLGKAGEVTAAIAKGVEAAKKNLVKVPVLKGAVPHEMEARFGGAQVFLKPAAAGTGLVAGGAMRAVLESAGIKDVLAKSKGSSNPHNLVKATIEALSLMRDAYTVAGTRTAYAFVKILEVIVILACKGICINATNLNEYFLYDILINFLIACSLWLSTLVEERILLQICTCLVDDINSLIRKKTVADTGITLFNGIFHSLLIIFHTVVLLVDRE